VAGGRDREVGRGTTIDRKLPYHRLGWGNLGRWMLMRQPLRCTVCGGQISSAAGPSWAYVLAATMPLLFEAEIREWASENGAGVLGMLGYSLLLVGVNFFVAVLTYAQVKRLRLFE